MFVLKLSGIQIILIFYYFDFKGGCTVHTGRTLHYTGKQKYIKNTAKILLQYK